jgi:hypothetical protein
MSPFSTQDRRWQAELAQASQQLRQAEAELASLEGEIRAFEGEVDAHLGSYLDQLSLLEADIQALTAEVQRRRDERLFGDQQVSYYTGAPRPGNPPPIYHPGSQPEAPSTTISPKPVSADQKPTLKELYRTLARRYHPDLASDEADRARRTEQMTAINQAFTAGDLAALQSLAELPSEAGRIDLGSQFQDTHSEEDALATAQRRLRQVRQQIQALNRLPSVALSLEVKLARRQGRDLLSEMAADLKRKIARKMAEREYLRSQLAHSEAPS